MASWMRFAVVKSGLRSERRMRSRLESSKGTSRSTMAPEAMRPLVGTPRSIEAACASALKPPTAIGPWATA